MGFLRANQASERGSKKLSWRFLGANTLGASIIGFVNDGSSSSGGGNSLQAPFA